MILKIDTGRTHLDVEVPAIADETDPDPGNLVARRPRRRSSPYPRKAAVCWDD